VTKKKLSLFDFHAQKKSEGKIGNLIFHTLYSRKCTTCGMRYTAPKRAFSETSWLPLREIPITLPRRQCLGLKLWHSIVFSPPLIFKYHSSSKMSTAQTNRVSSAPSSDRCWWYFGLSRYTHCPPIDTNFNETGEDTSSISSSSHK